MRGKQLLRCYTNQDGARLYLVSTLDTGAGNLTPLAFILRPKLQSGNPLQMLLLAEKLMIFDGFKRANAALIRNIEKIKASFIDRKIAASINVA